MRGDLGFVTNRFAVPNSTLQEAKFTSNVNFVRRLGRDRRRHNATTRHFPLVAVANFTNALDGLKALRLHRTQMREEQNFQNTACSNSPAHVE